MTAFGILSDLLLLAAAGGLAGALNAAAGGGSFITFPALVLAGVPAVAANATSTVALFPGSFASAWAYRRDFTAIAGLPVRRLLPTSLAGGLVGAILLLATPNATFDGVVPFLLLAGTLAFAGGREAGAWIRRFLRVGPATVLTGQFLLGVYGGYFGGAVGLMMMALWSLFGAADLRAMNAAKSFLVGATNSVAVLCFAAAAVVWWLPALVMAAAAVIGGYGGARLARRIPSRLLRLAITLVNLAMTAVFFWRAF